MKTVQIFTVAIVLLTLLSSCQSNTDIKQLLSKSETRKEIMDTIANNNTMSNEMMEVMMNSDNCKMMMQGNEKMTMMMMENHGTMMKVMKDNPGMMQSMMSDMMEACKSDTSMMSSMCKTMMGNHQMMECMNNMEGMDHKTKKKENDKSHH